MINTNPFTSNSARIFIGLLSFGMMTIVSLPTFGALDLLRPRTLHRISVDPRTGAGITYFDKVLESYRSAESISLKSASGVYVGRCYYTDHPMKPVASLVVVTKELGSRHGPLANDEVRFIPLVDRFAEPDRYDRISKKEIKAISNLALDFSHELALPVESRRETYVVGLRTPDEDSRLYRFRRNDNSLFLRLECAEDSVCLNANANLGRQTVHAYEGEPIAQCHYFKRFK